MGLSRALPPPRFFVPKAYFEDNPRDLHVLRHDKPLHPAIVKPHLRNVPDYLGTSHAPIWGGKGAKRCLGVSLGRDRLSLPLSYSPLCAHSAAESPRRRQTRPQEAQAGVECRCQAPPRCDSECGVDPPCVPPVSPLCPLCHWGTPTLIVSSSSPVPRLRQPAAELQVRPSPCQASCCATLLTLQTARGAPVLPRSPSKAQGVSLRHRRPQ